MLSHVGAAATEVRRASVADVPALARMLARAFHDDPVAEWACRHERLRPAMLKRFHGERLHQLVGEEEVWTAADAQSAAVWAPPGRWRTTVSQDLALLGSLLHPRLITRMPSVVRGLLAVEHAHPREPPHWYLAVLGTDPAAQGQGLGSAVLAPVLERCDADGVSVYLESSKERNIAFYARHGFRVTRELRLPRGPNMWAMWRDPSP
jgi:ribosomal protein S18 acetylase RimI-like enzyme